MKKTIILMAGILFSATSIFAFGINVTASTETSNDGLMDGIDDLVEDVKNNCICTMEYAPVCGKNKKGEEETYSNNCSAKCAGVTVVYKGKCKASQKEKAYNTGITGGIKNIHNKVPLPAVVKKNNPWVKVDEQFWFNSKTKEWKDKHGVCHTCTEENGFTRNGQIKIDGMVTATVDTELKKGENRAERKFTGPDFSFSFGDDKITVKAGNGVNLKNGFKLKKGEIKIDANNDGEEEISFFGNKNQIKIKAEKGEKISVKNGLLNFDNIEIKIDPDTTAEKARKAANADIVLSAEIKKDGNDVEYIVKTQKKKKFLGMFDFNMESEVKVNVETGVVVEVNEPWYSFLLF